MESRQRSSGTYYPNLAVVNENGWSRWSEATLVASCPVYQYLHWHYVDTGEQVTGPSSAGFYIPYASDQETIADVVGNKAGFNDCTHTKRDPYLVNIQPWETELVEVTNPHDYWWNHRRLQCHSGALQGLYDPRVHWAPGGGNYPSFGCSPDWNSLVQDVGEQLDGKMVASSNILVTVCQLAQTIKMFKNPFGLLQLRKMKLNKPFKQLAKFSSNVSLEWRYGWKQTWRDIINFATTYNRVRAHIKYLLETKDSWAPISVAETGETSYTLPWPDTGLYGLQWSSHCYDAKTKWTARFGVEILRGIQFKVATATEAILQDLGSTKFLEACWDLIPFSFVVDWLFDITEVLGNSPVYWNRYKLRRMGYSLKKEWICNLKFKLYTTNHLGQVLLHGEHVCGSRAVAREYTRTGGFPPDTSGVGLFGGLTIQNFGTGAALIAQRIL